VALIVILMMIQTNEPQISSSYVLGKSTEVLETW
jgi:hypothetical protein